MKPSTPSKLNIRKAARFAVIINAVQVGAMVAVLLYLLFSGAADRTVEIGALILVLLIVAWGAVLDIREAMNAQRIARQAQMLEEAYGQLEALNATLRRQRHDFMNHLQVVFSLMELGDSAEAMQYVESVYGDIKKTGNVLKTAIPAVNALIAAKRQDCEERGIALNVEIGSGWREMPVPGWEMCRVLGNLIDNARDALMERPDQAGRHVTVAIDETPGAFTFRVSNNGPAIPEALRKAIFQMGFTTKSDGHGSGLSIVKEILENYGGGIAVDAVDGETCFSGTIPKRMEGIAE